MIRSIALLVVTSLALVGCNDDSIVLPEPRMVCTQVTETYSCGRGGTGSCERCGNWEVGCPQPLKLQQIQDRDKLRPSLVCRMPGVAQ